MSGKIFFDTNVLVYAAGNDARAATAQAVLSEGGTISVQVLNEFANAARRKLKRSWPEIIDALAVLRALCSECLPITERTHDEGVTIARTYGVSFYDSLNYRIGIRSELLDALFGESASRADVRRAADDLQSLSLIKTARYDLACGYGLGDAPDIAYDALEELATTQSKTVAIAPRSSLRM